MNTPNLLSVYFFLTKIDAVNSSEIDNSSEDQQFNTYGVYMLEIFFRKTEQKGEQMRHRIKREKNIKVDL